MLYAITDSAFGADRIRSQYEWHIHHAIRRLANVHTFDHVEMHCSILTLNCHTTFRAERPGEWLRRHGLRLARVDYHNYRLKQLETA